MDDRIKMIDDLLSLKLDQRRWEIADEKSIPGCIVNLMLDELNEIVQKNIPAVRDEVLARPSVRAKMEDWRKMIEEMA